MASKINPDLLTETERAIYERNRRVATSDVLTLLISLCAARQAAWDAARALNAACEDEAINHNRTIGRAMDALYPQTYGLGATQRVVSQSSH